MITNTWDRYGEQKTFILLHVHTGVSCLSWHWGVFCGCWVIPWSSNRHLLWLCDPCIRHATHIHSKKHAIKAAILVGHTGRVSVSKNTPDVSTRVSHTRHKNLCYLGAVDVTQDTGNLAWCVCPLPLHPSPAWHYATSPLRCLYWELSPRKVIQMIDCTSRQQVCIGLVLSLSLSQPLMTAGTHTVMEDTGDSLKLPLTHCRARSLLLSPLCFIHGRRSVGDGGGRVPPTFQGGGDSIEIVPPYF